MAVPGTVHAQDYLGANAVLQQVQERNAKPGEVSAKSNEQTQLRDDLQAFSQTATNLPPADAARRWLELMDRAVKIQKQSELSYTSGSRPIGADELLKALPPPTAWSELAKAIAARPALKGDAEIRESGLRLLAATLTADAASRNREITNLQAKAKGANVQAAYFYRNILQQISEATAALSNDPDVILKSLERQLATTGRQGSQNITVPNLVSQVGAEKAESFLRKALVTPNVTINLREANETSRLAQKLALELMDQLPAPQWGLVNSLDAVELYEAFDKKFGKETNAAPSLPGMPPDMEMPMDHFGDYAKSSAQIYYFLGLISKDRAKDAVAAAKKINISNNNYLLAEPFKQMERAGYTAALDNFLFELLSQDPTLPFWNQYVELAAKAGQTARMVTLVRAAVARDDLSETKKAALQQILFRALLAADELDAGVQEMRRLIASDPPSSSRYGDGESQNAGQLGMILARIGMLVQKPEWTEEGIAAAKKWLAANGDQASSADDAGSVREALARLLFELKQGPEAEAILTDALASATRKDKVQPEYSWENPAQQVLAELAWLYHRAGRENDVLALLEQSPNWGANDLSQLFEAASGENQVDLMSLHMGSAALPVPYLAANSLMAVGRKEEAAKITDELLNRDPGSDRGYELLLALQGTNAILKLDELFARDQYEERPLIWKGHLLKQQGRLEEAEKIIRQAVAIDPSDGEEGRGDRMRVYAELADIREARGDQKEADFYREVVKAIRMSEDADQLYLAGLLKRAVTKYQEALSHFSDAYCIQSRLAIQLSALGMNDAAEEHYRRAFELMPDSFGRVESHCFGCEKAFDGERAQGIAEKVFIKIAAERPDKPQVHYLLGYLREEEERYNEARTNYLNALRLDPAYLNAWVRMQGISANVLMPPTERDELVFNILRLDPLQRHASCSSFSQVSDLAGLWNAVAVAESHQPAYATNLLALPASKIALEKKQSGNTDQSMEMAEMMEMQMNRQGLTPGGAVGENAFVRLAGELILTGNRGMDE